MFKMKLVSYSLADEAGAGTRQRSFGLISGDGQGVIDLAARLGVADLDGLIAGAGLQAASAFVDEVPDVDIDDVRFEPVVGRPSKIFCIGVNYGGRNAEYRDTSDTSYPSVFVRFPDSLTGHDQPLVRPPESEQLDYEGEIVVVIGTGGRRIAVSDARRHIAGVTLGNEGTIRDWVRHAKFNVTQGKNWVSSGSIGPWLVPIDELPPFEELTLRTTVNDEIRQEDSPATMKYPIEYQIHYLSTFVALSPGDVIFTGTPTGAGARLDPPRWLRPGDVVEVSVDRIGTLRNGVIDEQVPIGTTPGLEAP